MQIAARTLAKNSKLLFISGKCQSDNTTISNNTAAVNLATQTNNRELIVLLTNKGNFSNLKRRDHDTSN